MRILLIPTKRKIKLTSDQLQELLDYNYNQGYNDCKEEKKKEKSKIVMGFGGNR